MKGFLNDTWKIAYSTGIVMVAGALITVPVIVFIKGIVLFWNWIM